MTSEKDKMGVLRPYERPRPARPRWHDPSQPIDMSREEILLLDPEDEDEDDGGDDEDAEDDE